MRTHPAWTGSPLKRTLGGADGGGGISWAATCPLPEQALHDWRAAGPRAPLGVVWRRDWVGPRATRVGTGFAQEGRHEYRTDPQQ